MPHSPEIADVDWLVSEAATPWLAEASAQPGTVALAKRLRRALGVARAALVLDQAALRKRAEAKFPTAERMYFTAKALEQATSPAAAAYKAGRFTADAPVLDACCGIGGDLISLAARGNVTGLERDPVTARLAEANCRALGLSRARLVIGDAQSCDVAQYSAWHIDPDRRSAGRRTTQLEHYQPNLESLDRLLAVNRRAAIKQAPATTAPPHWQAEAELEWIGLGGECPQQVTWHGELARHAARRSATIVDENGAPLSTIIGDAGPDATSQRIAASLGRYVFEPHAAVLAAGLVDALAQKHSLSRIAARCVYLTGDAPVNDAALAAFEVQDVLPFDVKRLKRHLRDHGIGRLEVKKRGVDVDPEVVRRQLRGEGDESATILLARIGKRVQAVVAHRVGK